MKKILNALLMSTLLISCKQVNNERASIEINVNSKSQNTLDVSDFIDSAKYVVLETSRDNIIGLVSKVFLADDLIIISDILTSQVFIFDSSGKFRNKISKRGRGPGEYTKISNVMVDFDKEMILVYDVGIRKLLYYNYEGEYVKEIPDFNGGLVLRDIIKMNNGFFMCYRHDRSNPSEENPWIVWELTPDGEFYKGIIKLNEPHPVRRISPAPFLFYLPENKVGIMTASEEDFIYNPASGEVVKYLSYKVNSKIGKDYMGQYDTKEIFAIRMNTQYKGDYILTEWFNDESQYFVTLYSKKHDEIKSARKINFETEDITVLPFQTVPSNSTDCIVTSVNHITVRSFIDGNDTHLKIKDVWETLTGNVKKEQSLEINPVLQLLYVKK